MSISSKTFKVGKYLIELYLEWYADEDGKWSFIGYMTDMGSKTQTDGAGDIDNLLSLQWSLEYLNDEGLDIPTNNIEELNPIVAWVNEKRVKTFPNNDGKEQYYGM